MENMPKTGWDLRVLRTGSTAAEAPGRPSRSCRRPPPNCSASCRPTGIGWRISRMKSGQNQIWVRPFPNVDGGHWQISTGGGITPVWARSGKELFYLDGTNAVTSVPIQTAPTFSAGTPTKLFDGRYVGSPVWRTYDVSPDGQRFLMIKDNLAGDQTSAPASIVVVLNWLEELKRRVPAK